MALTFDLAEDLIMEDDLGDLLPRIEEANTISEALDMHRTFETVITTPSSRGELKGHKAVRNTDCCAYICLVTYCFTRLLCFHMLCDLLLHQKAAYNKTILYCSHPRDWMSSKSHCFNHVNIYFRHHFEIFFSNPNIF